MTPDRRLAYLSDIVSAVELIQSFASGKTAEALKEDILLRSGVERQFTIVGEAVSKLLRLKSMNNPKSMLENQFLNKNHEYL